jgi:hypothetical protein
MKPAWECRPKSLGHRSDTGWKRLGPPYDERLSETPIRKFRFNLKACFVLTAIFSFLAWRISLDAPEFRLYVVGLMTALWFGVSFALFGIRD